jgi:vacuolar-type H+-ATPase subunit I/STV1
MRPACKNSTEITRAHASRLDTIDERLDRLAASVAELSQTSTRHAQSLSELAEITRAHAQSLARLDREVRATRQQLGALAALVGAEAEVDAARVLLGTLRARGYEILGHPQSLSVDGEIDVAVPVRDASGRESWMVVEAKARLRASDIRQRARKLRQAEFRARLRAAGVREPIKAYAFGRMVYQDTHRAAREHGIGLLTPFGEVVEPV